MGSEMCIRDSKSTSGVFLGLAGPNTFFPLSAKAARQTSVSHSTVEAEIVAADTGVRTIGLPALDLWEILLGRLVSVTLMEDNESTFQIIKTGKNPTMRHISRTHGVNVQWLHDAYTKRLFNMKITKTDEQVADIFTKHFPEKTNWRKAVSDINTGPVGESPTRPPVHDPIAHAAKKKKKSEEYGAATSSTK